jgi:circadian clock protein KaiB
MFGKDIMTRIDSTNIADLTAKANRKSRYVLRLYVTGATARSRRAIVNLDGICHEFLKGQFDLEVIDVYQKPSLAKDEQIIAAPTLIKKLPLPMRRIIGDLSDREAVLLGLDLKRKRQGTK